MGWTPPGGIEQTMRGTAFEAAFHNAMRNA